MKTSRFNEEQIVKILRDAAVGDQSITSICRIHGIAENTFYIWRKKYGGVDVARAFNGSDIEQANTRRKRLLAERDLELEVIKEVLVKK